MEKNDQETPRIICSISFLNYPGTILNHLQAWRFFDNDVWIVVSEPNKIMSVIADAEEGAEYNVTYVLSWGSNLHHSKFHQNRFSILVMKAYQRDRQSSFRITSFCLRFTTFFRDK